MDKEKRFVLSTILVVAKSIMILALSKGPLAVLQHGGEVERGQAYGVASLCTAATFHWLHGTGPAQIQGEI
jgi:hypothetical protein